MARSRARTEAPMLRTRSRIRGHCIEIGLEHFPDSRVIGVAGDGGWARLVPAQRLLESLQCEVEAWTLLITASGRLAIPEHVDDGLGGIVDGDRYSFNAVFLDTDVENLLAEAFVAASSKAVVKSVSPPARAGKSVER